MADQFASPSDPVFWLHHGMVDYVWTLWQSRNFGARTYQGPGRTETARNSKFPPRLPQSSSLPLTILAAPVSPNASLDSLLDPGVLGSVEKLGNIASTVGGPLCYRYLGDS